MSRFAGLLGIVTLFGFGLLALTQVQALAQDGNDSGGNIALWFDVSPLLFLVFFLALVMIACIGVVRMFLNHE